MRVARVGWKTSGRTLSMPSGCSPRIRGPRRSRWFRWPWPSVPTPRCSAWWTACSSDRSRFREAPKYSSSTPRPTVRAGLESPSYPDFLDYQARGRGVADFIASTGRGVMVNVNGANQLVFVGFGLRQLLPGVGGARRRGANAGGKRCPLRRRAAGGADLLAVAAEVRRGGRYRRQDHHAPIPAVLCRGSGFARLPAAEPAPDSRRCVGSDERGHPIGRARRHDAARQGYRGYHAPPASRSQPATGRDHFERHRGAA